MARPVRVEFENALYHVTPRANLSQGLGWLQTAYSIRFNQGPDSVTGEGSDLE